MYKSAVIFGGSGFIGRHFAEFVIDSLSVEKVYLLDLKSPLESFCTKGFLGFYERGAIEFVECDVRKRIDFNKAAGSGVLVANFAAVHREPGHKAKEYYETNLLGAENVCEWASRYDCRNIIFTSSIAPYGPTEETKNETSLPVPISAYGGSKLVAEKIHLGWQKEKSECRRLIIVRPGVVFGPGEGGNVSRLIRAILSGYFVYMGNKETRKAGVYVKELCSAIVWGVMRQEASSEAVTLFNMTMNPGPSIQEYVNAVKSVSQRKVVILSVPYGPVYFASFVISAVLGALKVSHPFSPVRVKKLVRSNNISPSYLEYNGYKYRYTLEQAFCDWKQAAPHEW